MHSPPRPSCKREHLVACTFIIPFSNWHALRVNLISICHTFKVQMGVSFFMPYFGGICENKYLHLFLFWIHKHLLDLLIPEFIVTLTGFCYILLNLKETPYLEGIILFLFSAWVCNLEKKAKLSNYWKVSTDQILLKQVDFFVD